MSTEKCLDFLMENFVLQEKTSLLEKEDWVCLKKYKNFQGFTCRDFFNEKKNLKMIVLHDKEKEQMFLIENQNFLYFLKDQAVQPLFCYVPFLSNYGLTFLFCLYKDLSEKEQIQYGGVKLVELLLSKLKIIFSSKNVIYLEKEKMILITNHDLNFIAEKLEQNNFKLNTHIFEIYKDINFKPTYPDMMALKYHFPEDENKNAYQAIETIFLILSKQVFSDEIHTRVKKLLKKVPLDELKLSQKIAIDLNLDRKQEIKLLFEKELEDKKFKK